MARGKTDEASLRRETRESGERQLANERLQQEIEEETRILNEKQKAKDERQQQQWQREIEQEQTRRREEELCQCLSELSRYKGSVCYFKIVNNAYVFSSKIISPTEMLLRFAQVGCL